MEFDAILLPPRRAESIAKGWWIDRTITTSSTPASRPVP